ncbi:LysM peptidoglycan-binding domain-containing protein [Candidatus Gottesmanbacteria bacterium]|nr:LysM peptidoglycan-binding domain-containing protein [Candidatus Gottesmanbacteria bacterium]
MWKKYLKELSFPESYISITLGFLVVVVGGMLLYNFFTKNRPGTIITNETSNTTSSQEVAVLPTTHKVGENESLWVIAQKYYNSGYNWVTIAKANNLVNPDRIEVGQEMIIPKAETITPPSGEVSSIATVVPKTYTVVKGDDLWNIAVREYGDGYAWVRIAKENNLANPNIIHPGNVLMLPR